MSYVDELLAAYRKFVALPWQQTLAPPQRVWMAVYPPEHERRLRLHLPAFKAASNEYHHPWALIDITLAGMRGDRSVRDVCREHGIAETLYYGWRDRILEAGRGALAGKQERTGERELRRKVAELERALGRKTYELEIAGKALGTWQ